VIQVHALADELLDKELLDKETLSWEQIRGIMGDRAQLS
jgi:hypothetical protein